MKTNLTVDEIRRRLHVAPDQTRHGHRFCTPSGVVLDVSFSGEVSIMGPTQSVDLVKAILVPPTPWDSAQVAESRQQTLLAKVSERVREVCPTCGKQIRFSEDYGKYHAGTLHFETREELRQALDAPDLFSALHDFDVWLRDQIKHGDQHQFQPVRDELYRRLGEFLPQ